MAAFSLKTHLMRCFVTVTLGLALLIGVLGYGVIKRDVIDRAQSEVERALLAAGQSYQDEIDRMGDLFGQMCLVTVGDDLEGLRQAMRLHYIAREPAVGAGEIDSEIVQAALACGQGVGATRLMPMEQLRRLTPRDINDVMIEIKDTLHARPTEKIKLDRVMVKEYAIPIYNGEGQLSEVFYGGRVINRDFDFVDRIRNLVFGEEVYGALPIGTVTIFQDDVRIATNVLDESRHRAVGTRVSEEVYLAVVEKGQVWRDRAFVVTDWYKTAYEPIRSINDEIIGILYVGILEQPYNALAREALVVFVLLVSAATFVVVVISFLLANGISRPLIEMSEAAGRLSTGDFGVVVNTHTDVKEINTLGQAFNAMADGLHEREEWLKVTNEKLRESNKSYVDLIGFVAHELKGILASAVMNVYSVRDGFLGMINFKQRKAIDSVARNLDYLGNVVRKFLSLGQIERGDLATNKSEILLRSEVIDHSLDTLGTLADRKGLKLALDLDPEMKVKADGDLMLIVVNNLVSNAIKYSNPGANVSIAGHVIENMIEVEVYNDSEPMTDEQRGRLFHKFSRLDNAQTKKVKGTGLGLFIAKQIVEAHGGKIWAESREHGNAFIFRIERGLDSGDGVGCHQEETR